MLESGMTKITERMITMNPFAGLCHMVVCAHKDCTREEILNFCNHDNPSGTTYGWSAIENEGDMAPVICANDHDRIHYVIAC
jgi:hypothetical protein